MTVEQMRDKISRVYDGQKWKQRVKYMGKRQVIAIYYKFLESGQFEKPEVKKNMSGPNYVQMDIWELLKGANG